MVAYLLGLKSADVSTASVEAVNTMLKRDIDWDLEVLLAVDTDHLVDFLIVDRGFCEGDLD